MNRQNTPHETCKGQGRGEALAPTVISWVAVLGMGGLIYWHRTRIDNELWGAFSGVTGVALLDAMCGAAVSLRAGLFSLRRLPDFVRTNLLPQSMILFAVVLVADWYPAARAMVMPAAGLMVAAYGLDIKQKLQTLIVGAPPAPADQSPPDRKE